ncbi:MAG: hypothetical protein IKX54_03935 [Lachnospiraceae bacterium]|nr:hypothetical protein [Lachnospiraceae bacterium]
MVKAIKPDNAIFLSRDFQKDKYKFSLILQNLPSPELELYSDEESYVACRGSRKWPAWIWTSDSFDEAKIGEIEEVIRLLLTDRERDKFTCKKKLYDLLVKRNFADLNTDDCFEMGFLLCRRTKAPKACDGVMTMPAGSDLEVLAKYWCDDNAEMNANNPVTPEQARRDVEAFIADGNFYVLKNPEGKIVCMAGFNVSGEQAKITHVYTPVEERKKGYAANLIFLMTNEILKQGLVPLLYTDYNYAPSNRAYINAGYEDEGILINFSCSKTN